MNTLISPGISREVGIAIGSVQLSGILTIPHPAHGLVLFAHGGGSNRFSPGNQLVAERLRRGSVATLLVDLFTENEEQIDSLTADVRFDLAKLGERFTSVTDWILEETGLLDFDIGYFGAGAGAAAALIAAAERPHVVSAIVSRGGRPGLPPEILSQVRAPTLLIADDDDPAAFEMNRTAFFEFICEKKLETVPGASHALESRDHLALVADLTLDWFSTHLTSE